MTGRGSARQVGAGRKRGRGAHDGQGAAYTSAHSLVTCKLEEDPRVDKLDRPMMVKKHSISPVPSTSSDLVTCKLEEDPRVDNLDRPMMVKKRRISPVPSTSSDLVTCKLELYPIVDNLDMPMMEKKRKISPVPSTSSGFLEWGNSSAAPSSASDPTSGGPSTRRKAASRKNKELTCCVGSEGDDTDDDEVYPTMMYRTIQTLFVEYDEEGVMPAASYEEEGVMPAAFIKEEAPDAEDIYGPSYFDFLWRTNSEVCLLPEVRREKFEKRLGSIKHYETPYDAFVAIWDCGIMEHIARQTNLYAQQLTEDMMARGTLGPHSRITDWTDTNVDELYVWMGIVQAMGIVVIGRYEDYWTKDNDIFSTPGFKAHMSLRRFQLLNKCIHFNDNRSIDLRTLPPSEAKVYKVRPIIDHLNQKFKSMFQVGQNLVLDDSLTQWRRSGLSVGVRTSEVCDIHTGYMYCFDVHTGTVQPPPGVPVQNLCPVESSIPALVLKLLKDLKFQGHTVWMDNFYNSPALARTMKSMGFDCVGTLRTNCQFVPEQLVHLTKGNMRRGEMKAYTSGDVDIIVFRAQNSVALISTYHGNAVKECSGGLRPMVVLDYNLNMERVEKKDKMLAAFPLERKRTKVWYKNFFRRLLNISIFNSWIVWKHSSAGQRCMEQRLFRVQLVKALLQKHSDYTPQTVSQPKHVFPTNDIADNISKFSKFPAFVTSHFPVETEFYPHGKQRIRMRCAVCNKRVSSMCPACAVGLCATGSFPTCAAKYHTREENFQSLPITYQTFH